MPKVACCTVEKAHHYFREKFTKKGNFERTFTKEKNGKKIVIV